MTKFLHWQLRALKIVIPSPVMEYNTGNSDDEVEVKLHYLPHTNSSLTECCLFV
jgi:hypothetical protein